MESLGGLVGIVFVVALSYLLSENRKAVKLKIIFWGLGLQIVFVLAILGIPRLKIPGILRFLFVGMDSMVSALVNFTDEGARFVFGGLASSTNNPFGFIFAFRALPTIIFFSALVAVLYHLGILQRVVKALAWGMQKTFSCSGAESLSTAANIFLGQSEAPILVKPYVASMTRSEIFCVMVGGMATIAAGVMGAYVGLLQDRIPDIGGHLLTASFMAAPGTLLISKLLIPETGRPETLEHTRVESEKIDSNVIEAATRGAGEGLQLALMVGAMLIAFIGLVALADAMLAWSGNIFGFATWGPKVFPSVAEQVSQGLPAKLSFSLLLGNLLSPVAWLIGIPWSEAAIVGELLGQKTILNEFVAYVNLAKVADKLSERSVIITSYALCGFANFSSIGIQVASIGTLAPNQRSLLAKLGLKALLAGSLTCLLTASLASLIF